MKIGIEFYNVLTNIETWQYDYGRKKKGKQAIDSAFFENYLEEYDKN